MIVHVYDKCRGKSKLSQGQSCFVQPRVQWITTFDCRSRSWDKRGFSWPCGAHFSFAAVKQEKFAKAKQSTSKQRL